MSLAMVVFAALMSGAGPDRSSGSFGGVVAEYEAKRAKTGSGADAQVALALWCEEKGLNPERLRHLTRAVLSDPRHTLARGLLGLVESKGKWLTPEAVAETANTDNAGSEAEAGALAEYNALRARVDELTVGEDERAQALAQNPSRLHAFRTRSARRLAGERIKLGDWCESRGLKPEALAEFTTAVRLDPDASEGWKRLGYVRHEGRWMTPEQSAADVADRRAQRAADTKWEPLLKTWRSNLRDDRKRESTRDRLLAVDDPRVLPMLERVFADAPLDAQSLAVQLADSIEAPGSVRLLLRFALQSAYTPVREAAAGALSRRPLREYGGTLVGLIRTPAKFWVQPVAGPGSKGILIVDTPRFRLERSYDAPPLFTLNETFRGYVGYDANGLPVIATGAQLEVLRSQLSGGQQFSGVRQAAARNAAIIRNQTERILIEANLKAAAAQQALAADVEALTARNEQAASLNERAGWILQFAAQAPGLKDDEEGWNRWYYDRIGYRYDPPAKVFSSDEVESIPPPEIRSCFAAGTPVRTATGPRAIESLRPGDRVLCQNVETGRLDFQPVTAVHHNPPGATVRLTLDGGETLVPSTYHRFWVAGKGWALARELKAGDVLRLVRGTAKVVSAEPGETVPVFNLDVARDHTYFVGAGDVLVHDNTLPESVGRPFDAATVALAEAATN